MSSTASIGRRLPTSLLLIPVFSFLFLLPSITLGSGGDNLIFHTLWSRFFSQLFWEGDPYPRWLPQLNADCGSPVFFFYPPVAYFTTSLFPFSRHLHPEGWYPIVLATGCALTVGGFSCYRWLRGVAGHRAAIAGALLFLVMPYTAITFHTYLSLGELFSICLVPLLLHFARRLAEGSSRAILGYAIVFALLLMSNIPGSIVSSGLPVAYFLFCSGRALFRRWWRMLASIALGIGLAGVYLVPMLTHLDDVFVGVSREQWSGWFQYSNQFLDVVRQPEFLVNAAIMAVVTVGAWTAVTLGGRRAAVANGREHHFWLAVSAVVFFMMASPSAPIWEALPPLQIMQFPWRLSSLLSVAATALVALVVSRYAGRAAVPGVVGLVLAIPLVLQSYHYASGTRFELATAHFEYREEGQFVDTYYRLKTVFNHDYLPRWAHPQVLAPHNIERVAAYAAERVHVLEGQAMVDVEEWSPRRILFKLQSETPSLVQVCQFYFPGWTATSLDTGTTIEAKATDVSGLLELEIPAGKHRISLRMERLPAELYGALVSVVSLILVLAIRFWCAPPPAIPGRPTSER